MPIKSQPFDIGKMNRGIDNSSPQIQITNGRCVTGENVEFLRSGGWSVRLGSAKKSATPFANDIVGITQLTRRDGTDKYLIFFDDGSIYDYDGTITFTDTGVSQNAPSYHNAINFFKLNDDYIVFTGGNDYIKKLSWVGDWGDIVSVSGTSVDDLITGLRYVSATEIYAIIGSGTAAGVWKWNGSIWATYCPLIETLTVHNYFALDGTDYVYAATSGGVYVFSGAWNFWMLLGTDTDEYFDVLAISTSEVYAVKDTKIRKWNGTAWSDVQTIGSATDYKIKYVNSIYIVLEVETVNFWTSENLSTWTSRTVTTTATAVYDFCYGLSNYVFIGFNANYIYINHTSSFSSYTEYSPGAQGHQRAFIAFNGTIIVSIVDTGDSVNNEVRYTSDLTNWSNYTLAGLSFSLYVLDGIFYTAATSASTLYKYSTDGSTWSFSYYPINSVKEVYYINGQYYTLAIDTTIKQAYSADGSTWQSQFTHYVYISDTEQYGCKADGVFYFNGTTWAEIGALTNVIKLVYIADDDIYSATDNGLYNWDGLSWTKEPVIGIDDIRDILYISATEIYVASYESGIYKYDGASWSKLGSSIGSNKITAIVGTGNLLYAGVEEEGVSDYTIGYVLENVGDRTPTDIEPFVFDGTVSSAGTTIDTIDAGDVEKLKIGAYITHPSFPNNLYIIGIPSTTSITVSEPLLADTYTGIGVVFAPRSRFVEVYNDILFAANVKYEGTEQTSEIHFSRDDSSDMDEWFGIATGIRRILSVGFNDNDEITGIKTIGRVLGIWKNNTLHALTGVSEENFTLTKISDVGCIAPNSLQVCVFNNGSTGAVFMGRSGFYVFDGSNVMQNDSMKYYEYDLDMTRLNEMTSVFDKQSNKYKCSFYVNGGGRKTVVYQSQLDAFSEETNYADAYGLFEDVEYRALNKDIYRDNSGILDDTTPITFTFKTALYVLNTPGILKVIREFLTEYKSQNADYTMNVYVENNAVPVYTISVDNSSTEKTGTDRRSFGVNTQYVQFEITGTATVFEFYRLVFKFRMIGER